MLPRSNKGNKLLRRINKKRLDLLNYCRHLPVPSFDKKNCVIIALFTLFTFILLIVVVGFKHNSPTKAEPLSEACSWSITDFGKDEKIDIVIPYFFNTDDAALKYELRSFEKYGLLDMVNTVYVITGDAESEAESEQKTENMFKTSNQLKVLAIDEIETFEQIPNMTNNPQMWKITAAPFIDNLAPNYVYVPDDVVLTKPINRDIFYNFGLQKAYTHSFGTFNLASCLGYPNIAPFHGPSFVNQCAMKHVILDYYDGDNEKNGEIIDPICVAIGKMNQGNLTAGFYGYHDYGFKEIANYSYFEECHTNGGCTSPNGFNSYFVNIQGNGISAEYGKNEELKGIFDKFFEENYPKPSRFERE